MQSLRMCGALICLIMLAASRRRTRHVLARRATVEQRHGRVLMRSIRGRGVRTLPKGRERGLNEQDTKGTSSDDPAGIIG